ncbi:hypothetical protein PLICRDRAFT_44987 [Plicaturopsis crispa FD-325 SS-3]|nr:hypothetical protein PLICRDRAFT_44987 [Plicaturopsis crispa FD-325 SS-3]
MALAAPGGSSAHERHRRSSTMRVSNYLPEEIARQQHIPSADSWHVQDRVAFKCLWLSLTGRL